MFGNDTPLTPLPTPNTVYAGLRQLTRPLPTPLNVALGPAAESPRRAGYRDTIHPSTAATATADSRDTRLPFRVHRYEHRNSPPAYPCPAARARRLSRRIRSCRLCQRRSGIPRKTFHTLGRGSRSYPSRWRSDTHALHGTHTHSVHIPALLVRQRFFDPYLNIVCSVRRQSNRTHKEDIPTVIRHRGIRPRRARMYPTLVCRYDAGVANARIAIIIKPTLTDRYTHQLTRLRIVTIDLSSTIRADIIRRQIPMAFERPRNLRQASHLLYLCSFSSHCSLSVPGSCVMNVTWPCE